MTTTKEIASKLSVALVAVAMVFSAFASTASAQTTEELQAMINDLLAQVAALQTTTSGTAVGGTCTSIMAPLTIGSRGGDVMALQNYLMTAGFSIPAGPTDYFGGQTQAALAQWQAANGVAPAVGYYGPITKAAIDAKCVVAEDEDMDEDEDESEDDSDMTLSGEASLDGFDTDSASDDSIEEGDTEAEVMTGTVEFRDGDAEITRVDVSFVGSGDEVDPWDTFETVSLWIDGDMIDEMNADDEDDYLDEDDGSLRFTNLSIFAEEDEEVEIVVAVTVQNSVDGTNDGEDWAVAIDGMRFFDADGVATTLNDADDTDFGSTETFTIEEAGYDDEIIVKTSSNDPDATTLQVEDDQKSDWYTVFVFDIDTDDSINDIMLNMIDLDVTMGSGTYNTFVDDAELVIDGTTIDDVTVTNGGTGLTATLSFDVDGDVEIDAGDRVEAELMLRFKSLSNPANEGVTVMGKMNSATITNIDAEGADDLDNTQLSGSAIGDAHTLRTTGIDTDLTDDSAVVTVQDGNLNDYATFELEVEVTAFEQDVFIDVDGDTSINWSLVDGSGAAVTAGTSTVVLTSTADENNGGGYYEINEGETETLTFTVTYVPGAANTQARVRMDSIAFAATAVAATQTQSTLPATDYRTSVVTIVN